MEKYNITFTLARSTDEALGQLADQKFDAIISDMGRPPDGRAGYTLLRALRSRGNQTPFFIYAGSRKPEHVAEAFRRGAQGAANIPSELISMVLGSLRTDAC
jgi:CheY-like chemotaxis protein